MDLCNLQIARLCTHLQIVLHNLRSQIFCVVYVERYRTVVYGNTI